MKYISFTFLMLFVCQIAFSQSKKEQIETLIFQKDSLSSVLEKERQLNSNQVKELETKISKINSDMSLILKNLSESKRVLAEKEEEILGFQLDHVLLEDTIRNLREELNQLKSFKVTSSDEVVIGSQVWMDKNLDVVRFRNGDVIPEAKTEEEWLLAFKNKQPAWSYYNNDPNNGKKYGKLYNCWAVRDSRILAPIGWHIPSEKEWKLLINFLGGEEVAGEKMKSKSGWEDYHQDESFSNVVEGLVFEEINRSGNGTNSSGFSGYPFGTRSYNHVAAEIGEPFLGLGQSVYWWSTTIATWTNNEIHFGLSYSTNSVDGGNNAEMGGLYVRCIKD